jgi:hypothetical protein
MATGAAGWIRPLTRATLIVAVLQLGMAVVGHYEPRVAALFAVLGMFFSMVAGYLFGWWSRPLGKVGAAAGGAVAGAVCAFIGIVESYTLGDVPAWVLAFGPVSSAVTGAVGGWLGRITRN